MRQYKFNRETAENYQWRHKGGVVSQVIDSYTKDINYLMTNRNNNTLKFNDMSQEKGNYGWKLKRNEWKISRKY
jgi:hypothetical protein